MEHVNISLINQTYQNDLIYTSAPEVNDYDNIFPYCIFQYMVSANSKYSISESRLTVVSREAKEEVPYDGLSTNAREYFTRTNLAKTKNTITYEP